MSALQAPSRNGPVNPNSPVPLDTIPISPAKDSDSTSSGDETATVKQHPSSKTSKAEDDLITVFHDPENFNVKHPLMNEWTLWFTKPPSGKVCSLLYVSVPALTISYVRATTGMISSKRSSLLIRSKNSGAST